LNDYFSSSIVKYISQRDRSMQPNWL